MAANSVEASEDKNAEELTKPTKGRFAKKPTVASAFASYGAAVFAGAKTGECLKFEIWKELTITPPPIEVTPRTRSAKILFRL